MKSLALAVNLGLLVTSSALAFGEAPPAPAPGPDAVKIDTVESEYVPTDTNGTGEKVFLDGYSFEINPDNGRVRVDVDYDYQDSSIYSHNDDGGGPRSTLAMIPGLTYDVATHSVLYRANGRQSICATVDSDLGTKNTGACAILTVLADHPVDDGWEVHHDMALDVYFQAR